MSNFDLILDAFVFSILIIIIVSIFAVFVAMTGLFPIFIFLFIIYLLIVNNNNYLRSRYIKSSGIILTKFDNY